MLLQKLFCTTSKKIPRIAFAVAFLMVIILSCLTLGRVAARLNSHSIAPIISMNGISGEAELARYQLATDYSEQYRGLSVLVLKGDKVVFEEYQNGHTAEKAHMLASGTKSFTGVMAAAAIEDKLLRLDERVSETITEWKTDPRRAKITINQLLHLTSGIAGGTIGRPPAYADAIKDEAAYEPGEKFQYGPAPFQIFGEVMRRKLVPRKQGPLDYLKQRILDPIGLKISFWQHGLDGNPHLPSGAYLTAREWAKFGIFVKEHGSWKGKQVIAKKLIDQCFEGSKANPAYGLSFWLNAPGDALRPEADDEGRLRATDLIIRNGIYAKGPRDLVMAAGAGQQRLYIIPSLDLVIVRQGRISRFRDAEFLARLLDGKTAGGQALISQK